MSYSSLSIIVHYNIPISVCFYFFFFNDTATTEIYTLSLHDALPISANFTRCAASSIGSLRRDWRWCGSRSSRWRRWPRGSRPRSEEHTSELQSRQYLVCRLLLEKKKKIQSMMLYVEKMCYDML